MRLPRLRAADSSRARRGSTEALWAPTFADLAALLLGLFALLVAVHEPDPERFAELRAEWSGGSGAREPSAERAGREPRARLRVRLAAWSREHGARVAALHDEHAAVEGVWIELDAPALCFGPGSADPSSALRVALQALPAVVADELARVEVGGHLSADELRGERSTNDLALERARTALRTLRESGSVARAWSTASYGNGLAPAGADPRTPEGRSAARRVTLRLEVAAP